MKKILFRVDSSKEIGFGHLHRCLNLAEELKKNFQITFVCRYFNSSNLKLIKKKKFKLLVLKIKNKNFNQDQDARETINNLHTNFDLAIVDHYKLGFKWEKILSRSIKKIMVIDDYLNKKHFCNIILNYNHAVKKKIYKKYFLPKTSFLVGSKYIIINKKYLKVRSDKTKRLKILIFFGTDNKYTTKKLIKLLDQNLMLENKFEVVLTKGITGFNDQLRYIKKFKNCNVYFGLPDLSNIISKSQIGIISGGQIVNECLVLGIPTIVFSTAKNHEKSCKFLQKHRLINFMGNFNKDKKNFFLYTLRKLLKNRRFRNNQSKNLKNIVDGKGVKRIADYLYNEI